MDDNGGEINSMLKYQLVLKPHIICYTQVHSSTCNHMKTQLDRADRAQSQDLTPGSRQMMDTLYSLRILQSRSGMSQSSICKDRQVFRYLSYGGFKKAPSQINAIKAMLMNDLTSSLGTPLKLKML